MRHNLRQEEVGRGLRLEQILQPADEDPCADSPSHKLQFGLSPTNRLTELPPTLDAAARADSGVSPKHDQRSEPMLPGTVGVVEVVVKRVLRRQKRDDSIPRRIVSEISDEMAQVVFLVLSDGAIGEKNVCVVLCESTNGVVRIDPGFDSSGRIEFGARRPKLGSNRVNSTGRRNTSMMRCCDAETETETVRPGGSACDAFAWSAAGNGACGAATVLEGDRAGAVE